jgi:hypothetical protein
MKKRLTLISDTHNKHEKLNGFLPGGDILIHSGDLTGRGYTDELEGFFKWYDKIDNYDHKIFIAGNHDFGFQDDPDKIKGLLTRLRDTKAQIIKQQQQQPQQQQPQTNPNQNKILVVGIDPNDLNAFTIEYNTKRATIMVNQILNKSSYLFFDESLRIPLGTFDYYLTIEYIRDRLINLFREGNRIVIKINQQGSLKELFRDQVSNSNAINKSSFNNQMRIVDNFLERKLAQSQEE